MTDSRHWLWQAGHWSFLGRNCPSDKPVKFKRVAMENFILNTMKALLNIDYRCIAPPIFVELLERVVVFSVAFITNLHCTVLPKSLATRFMSGPALSPLLTLILRVRVPFWKREEMESKLTSTLEFLAQLVASPYLLDWLRFYDRDATQESVWCLRRRLMQLFFTISCNRVPNPYLAPLVMCGVAMMQKLSQLRSDLTKDPYMPFQSTIRTLCNGRCELQQNLVELVSPEFSQMEDPLIVLGGNTTRFPAWLRHSGLRLVNIEKEVDGTKEVVFTLSRLLQKAGTAPPEASDKKPGVEEAKLRDIGNVVNPSLGDQTLQKQKGLGAGGDGNKVGQENTGVQEEEDVVGENEVKEEDEGSSDAWNQIQPDSSLAVKGELPQWVVDRLHQLLNQTRERIQQEWTPREIHERATREEFGKIDCMTSDYMDAYLSEAFSYQERGGRAIEGMENMIRDLKTVFKEEADTDDLVDDAQDCLDSLKQHMAELDTSNEKHKRVDSSWLHGMLSEISRDIDSVHALERKMARFAKRPPPSHVDQQGRTLNAPKQAQTSRLQKKKKGKGR